MVSAACRGIWRQKCCKKLERRRRENSSQSLGSEKCKRLQSGFKTQKATSICCGSNRPQTSMELVWNVSFEPENTEAEVPSARVVRSCPCACSFTGKCPDPETERKCWTDFFLFFFCPNTVFFVKDTLKQPAGVRVLCA